MISSLARRHFFVPSTTLCAVAPVPLLSTAVQPAFDPQQGSWNVPLKARVVLAAVGFDSMQTLFARPAEVLVDPPAAQTEIRAGLARISVPDCDWPLNDAC